MYLYAIKKHQDTSSAWCSRWWVLSCRQQTRSGWVIQINRREKRENIWGVADEDKRLTDCERCNPLGSCFNTSNCATNRNRLTGKPGTIPHIGRGQEGERQQTVSYNQRWMTRFARAGRHNQAVPEVCPSLWLGLPLKYASGNKLWFRIFGMNLS